MKEGTCSQQALAYFKQEFNCAQSVLMAHGEITGLPPKTAARIMSGFGGGIGECGGLCGAVSAVVALVGLVHGREEAQQRDRQEDTYERIRSVLQAFHEEYQANDCYTLLGESVTAPGAKELARNTICPKYVSFCCLLVDKYVLDLEEEGDVPCKS